MRGKAVFHLVKNCKSGITPAYAGKSELSAALDWEEGDHPRLCGEKLFAAPFFSVLSGSPPPMRGKVDDVHQLIQCVRITPAYAGKSGAGCKVRYQRRGSPPPMRGKGRSFAGCFVGVGITPAYAGKSARNRSTQWLCGDHPRLCGEKEEIENVNNGNLGSPPPMRGKDKHRWEVPAVLRITPAYAGKSGKNLHRLTDIKDHPRLCGEKIIPNLHHFAI